MEKHIMGENGISYTLGEDGLYYPDLYLPEETEYLIDEECNQMMDRLVEQMKEKQGVTEELKMQNQMAWVGRMNNIRACAEEMILKEIVCE